MKIAAAFAVLVCLAGATAIAQETHYGNWVVREWAIASPSLETSRDGFKDTITQDPRISLTLTSTDGKAQLVLFHQWSDLELYVKWNEYVDHALANDGSHDTPVFVSIDGAPATRSNWRLSNSLQATFYSRMVSQFVRQLLESDTLSVQVVPFGGDYVTHTFELAGLNEAIHVLDGHFDYTKAK